MRVKRRCAWVGDDPLYQAYHDREWGVPVHDDRRLFEMLILEGAQAGLSWLTILRKREHYRRAFDGFDAALIAAYRETGIRRLLADPGIVRNRLKVRGVIQNARAFLALREDVGSFDRFVWGFVGGRPKRNSWTSRGQVPARTTESDALSRALKERGFTFVGSTICYAFMQAVGLVNDHTRDCFRYRQLRSERRPGPRVDPSPSARRESGARPAAPRGRPASPRSVAAAVVEGRREGRQDLHR